MILIPIIIIAVVIVVLILYNKDRKNTKKIEDDHRFYPIKFYRYNKQILIQGMKAEHIMSMIKEHTELCDEPVNLDKYDIIDLKEENWYKVKCPEEITFYGFHNLVNWFYGKNEYCQEPKAILGLALHESDQELSYYVVQDKNSNYGDTVIGRFNNGKSFSVYLPESYNDRGNMMIEANSLIEKNIGEMLARYKLSVPI